MYSRKLKVVWVAVGILSAVCLAADRKPPPKPAKAKPPAPKASKPVVKDGLSISVRPSKAMFARGEAIGLEVTFANVSTKPLTLGGSRMLRWMPTGGFTFIIKNVKTGEVRTLRAGMNPMIRAPVRMENKTIAAGKSVMVPAAIDRWSWSMQPVPARGAARARKLRKYLGTDMLPGGTYQVTVSCKFGKGWSGGGASQKFWIGDIAAGPVIVKVDPNKVVARPPGAGQAKWIKLFADERWYKARQGSETTIMGTLQAVPQAGGATTLQRTAFYTIGKFRIYTAGRKHPALEKLVGKGVTIRGKIVLMELEGRSLREIWPASVRSGGGPTVGRAVPGISRPIRGIIRRVPPTRVPGGGRPVEHD